MSSRGRTPLQLHRLLAAFLALQLLLQRCGDQLAVVLGVLEAASSTFCVCVTRTPHNGCEVVGLVAPMGRRVGV